MASPAASFLVFIALSFVAYDRITTEQLNCITGLLFLTALSALLWFVVDVLTSACHGSRSIRQRIRLSMASATIMIVVLELSLRGVGKYANYYEQNGNPNYRSVYSQGGGPRLHVNSPNRTVGWALKEYGHSRETNSLGLSERQISETKSPTEYRIVALGDSFTEGVGTSYESTWVKVAEKDLADRSPGRAVSIINAGISGSDVYFEYVLLREKLLAFAPDLVIVAINNSDVNDIIISGGAERFNGRSKLTVSRHGPKWEWLYGISYVFRHVMHGLFGYSYLLLSPDEAMAEERRAAEKIERCIDDFVALARERHFQIMFAFIPHKYEIRAARYLGVFQDVVDHVTQSSTGGNALDLLSYYTTNKIITRENSDDFYWRIDAHHNARGYEAMGKAIANKVVASHYLDQVNAPQ
jgi:lysophospholipase L1-like esterase